MQIQGKHIVISGLSATGKTTLLRHMGQLSDVITVPEHIDWIGGGKNFPKAPLTIEEKKEKQRFFLQLDIERNRWARQHLNKARIILSDSDFTSPLAHNYAERWLHPHLDVYEWLIETYCECLYRGELVPADGYIYLDATLEQRVARRQSDTNRKRNEIFFTKPFPDNMRCFYFSIMHSSSPRSVLPTTWYNYSGVLHEEIKNILQSIEQFSHHHTSVDIEKLKQSLRSTVSDSPQRNSAEITEQPS